MRVLLVNHRFPPDGLGGVESYTQNLAADLVKAGDTVSIVTRRPSKSLPKPEILRELLPCGASLYCIAGGNFVYEHYGSFLLYHEDVERCFTTIMIEAVPDVVHVNHMLGQSPRFFEIAHRLRAAVVLSLHDFYFVCPRVHLQKPSGELCAGPDGGRECARTCFAQEGATAALRWGLRTAYFRRLLSLAERTVCYSGYVASYFKAFGVRPIRIPLGVSVDVADPATSVATPAPKERGTLNLAFCGILSRHKGAHLILEALRGAELGPVDLVLFGQCHEGSYEALLRERAAAIPGLKFRMYGKYQGAELRYLLHDVDAVIVPSLVPETGGLVPREALARGVPVVVSRLGALPEVVAEGENGFTFDPDRPEELAAILRRLRDDEGLLRRLRAGALRTPVVTAADHAGAIRSVYQEAIEDLLCNRTARAPDLSEIGFLHGALIALGTALVVPHKSEWEDKPLGASLKTLETFEFPSSTLHGLAFSE
jgi:glycosyltransferase involved in cell wall biosynthesis